MQKTKLGISVGLLGAAIYFMGAYAGYVITGLLVGYVLLFENNMWLKKAAVKALTLMVGFSVLSTVIYLLPSLISILGDFARVFNGYLYVEWISDLANAVSNVVSLFQRLLFIGLGIKALTQSDIAIKAVDNFVDKYME